MSSAFFIVMILTAFGIGALNTGYYLVKVLCHQDIRLYGSGSTGARNVGRLMGPSGFFWTLVGDMGKGVILLWLGGMVIPNPIHSIWLLPAVTLGQIYPPQLGFRGGKGVAVLIGGILIWITFSFSQFDIRFLLPILLAFFASLFAHRKNLAHKSLVWQSPAIAPANEATHETRN